MPKQNPCLKAFQICGEKGREFQRFLDERWPGFSCECSSVSPYSSGTVANGEDVVRLVIHPIHYDNGKLTATAFEDLTNYDLSVFRVQKSKRQEVEKTRNELVARGLSKNPPTVRMIDLVCRAAVSDIRQKVDSNGRMLGVYDTALESCTGHASVFSRSDLLSDRRSRFQARQIAYQIFSARIDSLDAALDEMIQ